jgi:beta-glucosidase
MDKETFIQQLLSKMTIEEKIGQCIMLEPAFCLDKMNQNQYRYDTIFHPDFLHKLIYDYHAGSFLFGGITRIGSDKDTDWNAFMRTVQEIASGTKHKIPLLYGVDAIHGANFIKDTVIFSHNLGLASTWNKDLAKEYGKLVSDELEAIGLNVNFAPTIDVSRDQRWGRVYESLGEDPFLASQFASVLVEGMQTDKAVSACAKHFVGYGESFNGMDRVPADISDRQLWEQHLPSFIAAIDAGVQAIMVSGGDLNGTPMPANKKMLTDVLRDELQFEGIVMTDWEDVFRLYERHRIVRSKKEAVAKSFNAGVDVNMAVNDFEAFKLMKELIEEQTISMDRLNQAVARVLGVKWNLGLFEEHAITPVLTSDKPYRIKSKEAALDIARESMTLLKNDGNTLPLSKDIKRLLVTGKGAHSKRHLCGGWTLNWASAQEEDLHFPTILDTLQETLPNCDITYVDTVDGLHHLEGTYDACITVVTEEPHSEWLGDSFDLQIEEDEDALLKAAVATNIPVVMVNVLGRPQDMLWADQLVSSILYAYLPGTMGGQAIVETLFGDNNPSGKTVISFPKNANQIPIVYNPRGYYSPEIQSKYNPLYPFGYGLSYTTFEYSNLHVPSIISEQENLTITVDVTNTGQVSGKEVVQVYITDLNASVTRPLQSLKGFRKVLLDPQETTTCEITISLSDLKLYNENMDFVTEPRMLQVCVDSLQAKCEIV